MPTGCPLELGGDVDVDGVCGDDDNCPDDFNPDQSNVDDDGAGDVCDDVDGLLDMRRASLRQSNSSRGRVLVRGDILLSLPDDEFIAADGVAVQVLDGLDLNLSLVWDASECVTLKSGRVSCKSGDRRFQGRFKPLSKKVGRLSFAITFKNLNLAGPFAAPVMLVITDNPAIPVIGVDRVGMIGDCRETRNGLVCRSN